MSNDLRNFALSQQAREQRAIPAPKPLEPAERDEYMRLLAIGTQRGPAHGDGHALREAAREIAALKARTAKMRSVLEMCLEVEGTNSASYDPEEYNNAIREALKP